MDMRCDSVDIATFLGVYGMAATRVNRGNDRHKRNETKQGSGIRINWNRNYLLSIEQFVWFRQETKSARDDLRETSRRMGLVR